MYRNKAFQDVLPVAALVPGVVVANGTTNGTGVDIRGFDVVSVKLALGTVTGTTVTIDVKVQDSPDNSVWTDIPGAVFAQKTEASDGSLTFGLINSRYINRYIRVVLVVGSAASPVVPYYIEFVLDGNVRSQGTDLLPLTEFNFLATVPTA